MKALALTNALLCLAALLFSFSVAATNVALALVLTIGLLSGFWWQGAKQCWASYRALSIAFIAYFSLMLVALSWSLDVEWGVHVLGRQWFWLLIPIVVASLQDEKWRNYFLFALSIGLALNLIYCVLQMYGYVTATTPGSSADDATGHIGRIGFGVVYGIWAAWLLHWGWLRSGWLCWLPWLLAAWACLMVFMAQGKGGYLVVAVLMMSVQVYRMREGHVWRRLVWPGVIFMLLASAILLGPGEERWHLFWNSMVLAESSNTVDLTSSTGQRLHILKGSLEIWRLYPLFGVGTGGLPEAAKQIQTEADVAIGFHFAHPHNQYLLSLVRWGPLGLLLLLALLFFWLRDGWRAGRYASDSAPLFLLSGLALAIHGLFAPSLEEHFSAILAALLLATAMSTEVSRSRTSEGVS